MDLPSRDSHQLADENSSFSLVDAFLADRKEERESAIDNSFLFQPSVSSDYVHWTLTADDASVAADPAVPLQHQDLIDSFIQKEEERPAGNLAMGEKPSSETLLESPVLANETDSKSLDDSYFTETLAHIYVKQKRYEKALQIIKNLSLKYPEKNVYFADQIRFLEKLIINTKK